MMDSSVVVLDDGPQGQQQQAQQQQVGVVGGAVDLAQDDIEGAPRSLHCIATLQDGHAFAVAGNYHPVVFVCRLPVPPAADPSDDVSVHRLYGHLAGVTALGATGSYLASGSKDCTVKVWNPVDLTCVRSLHLHNSAISVVKWLADGYLATADEGGGLALWDIQDYDHPTRFDAHQRAITAIEVVSPSLFVSGDNTGKLVFWTEDGNRKREHGACIDATAHITGAAGVPDGIIIITAADQRLRLWSSKGDPLKDMRVSFDYSRDQRWSISHLAAGPQCSLYVGLDQFACDTEMNDQMVLRLVYDIKQGFTQEQGFAATAAGTSDSVGRITALAISPLDSTVLAGCEKKYAFALDPASLSPTTPTEGPFDGNISGITWLADKAYAAVTVQGEVFVRLPSGPKDVHLPTRTVSVVNV
ncbi:hypothetical protein PTSG_08659 [Salpingoeca rosetta]|uniref:Uncharacterized protein n=1 Tax=Salpingoeca rosetta (strain ATCC 50818 / BSB-021) TaxID=946362 RepID=F2UKB2_SALR5|nr:uncharacterized protein PTSG_08659 [Salpingoeca rosetta]EGD77561.1 hypothetical protein PTSG_08659 [Salpingoeca rosetta]|eukprot:XP_004990449.1 hypothetical protein PTSG_08659 [Salpingoeca rosetta]